MCLRASLYVRDMYVVACGFCLHALYVLLLSLLLLLFVALAVVCDCCLRCAIRVVLTLVGFGVLVHCTVSVSCHVVFSMPEVRVRD